jgi:hypothetical protein
LGAVQKAMGATTFVRTLKGRDVSDLGSGNGPGALGRQSSLELGLYLQLIPVLPEAGGQGGAAPPITLADVAAIPAAAPPPDGSDRRTA